MAYKHGFMDAVLVKQIQQAYKQQRRVGDCRTLNLSFTEINIKIADSSCF